MSAIGGPGGVGGPKGPSGPDGPGGPEGADAPATTGPLDQAAATNRSEIDALAAEVAAGRLTPREAIDRMVDAAAGPELGPAERAELRELLTDLVASDPYLGSLAGRV
jgi:hypothetical protein